MRYGRGVAPKPLRIQREGAQLQIRGTWSAGPGDDQARFLADLRALRDSAAIGYDELAARAHYPSDILKEAENGPSMPGLPILTAYVRACGGDVLEWEERWRRLNPEARDDPNLPVRPAGASPAAVAGARAGIGVVPPDAYDPDRIRAALRGGQARSGQSRKANDPGVSAPAASSVGLEGPDQEPSVDSGSGPGDWAATPGWDATPDPGVTTVNGNHTVNHGNRGPFDAVITSMPEAAEPTPAEEFSWLQKGTTEPRPESELTWPEQAGNEPAPASADSGFWSRPTETGSVTELADTDLTWPERPGAGLETGSVAPEPDITERLPRHQADLTSEERTDLWSKPVPGATADLRRPAAPPRLDEPAVTRASWTTHADTVASPAAEPAHRDVAAASAQPLGASAQSIAAPAQSLSAPGQSLGASAQSASASPQPVRASGITGRAAEADSRRPDRFFPVRLLVVIVIAALIGSALVLLLK
jgi:hypothetical protein